jgi:large subunit ribosomal protein L10
MAITKQKKEEILSKIKEITGSNSVVFANFKGISADDTVDMRKKMRESGVTYYVAKKTLIQKAFSESGIEGDLPELSGELALVYADEDVTAPARETFNFQKEFEGGLSIIGGVFENKYLSKEKMEEIALIPGHDVLLGMFVNVINSPIQGFVMSLKAIADKREQAA